MHAIDDLGDALDASRNFLTPVRPWTWTKLALIVIFIGGAGGGFSGFSFDPTMADPATGEPVTEVTAPEPEVIAIFLIILLGALIIGLIWAYIAAVLEFVFFNSLRDEAVHVRRYFKAHLRNGLHLLGFRIGVGIAVLLLLLVPLALLFGLVIVLGLGGTVVAVGLLAFLPWLALVLLAQSVVGRFTTVFVVPVMIHEGRGIISAWKRFWPTVRREWKEYAVFYILFVILELVAAIAVGIIAFLVFLPIGIPILIVSVVLALTIIGLVIAIPLMIFGLLLFILIAAYVEMPVVTYFRYYALLVLGDTERELDLIPSQRARIRTDGGDSGPDGGSGGGRPPGNGPGPAGGVATGSDSRHVRDTSPADGSTRSGGPDRDAPSGDPDVRDIESSSDSAHRNEDDGTSREDAERAEFDDEKSEDDAGSGDDPVPDWESDR